MNEPLDPSLGSLNDCGCCAGVGAETPAPLANRPGLDRIAYRVGTHAEFKASLIAALSNLSDPVLAPLAGLRTRDDADFTIALLDAWAAVADVLTFYQERIANESYLRTATERLSILELARLIGYELRPGVAAATHLAFTMDHTAGSPEQTTLDTGVKVQSIPGPGETAQTFETVESIEARIEWNAVPARQNRRVLPAFGDNSTWLRGASTNLKAGDILLLVGRERETDPANDNWDARRVTAVAPDHDRDLLQVTWQPVLGSSTRSGSPSANPRAYVFRQRASLFGHNAPDWETLPASLRFGEYVYDGSSSSFKIGAFANRDSSWAEATLAKDTAIVWLDAVYSTLTRGSWILVSSANYTELYGVTNVSEESHADFNLSAKVTRLDISGENIDKFSPRNCGLYVQSEELDLAEIPITDPVRGSDITLDVEITDPGPGRMLAASGPRAVVEAVGKGDPLSFERADGSVLRTLDRGERLFELDAESLSNGRTRWHLRDANLVEGYVTATHTDVVRTAAETDDPVVYEIVELASVDREDDFHSRLHLKTPLHYVYDRQAFRIGANVAAATHGETVPREVLGSGDATQSFQQFTLRQSPVTFLRSKLFPGFASTLELRVNDLLWHEQSTLYASGPLDRVFVARRNDDGKTHVEFGDGITGARLPSGVDNIRVIYRKGIGLAGNVAAGQLTMLLTRPLGLKAVVNPVAAEGGDDPETLDDARTNAPLQVLTLGRVVSLEDYEGFARAYPGIDKALATWTWDGHSKRIVLTLAGPDGAAIDETGDVAEKLSTALAAAGEPFVRVQLKSYHRATFKLAGGLVADPDFDAQEVLDAVKAKLAETFSFDARNFGQPVHASEVIAAIHAVAGVVAVDLERLYRSDAAAEWNDRVLADLPAGGTANVPAAELLTLDDAGTDDLEAKA